jgi:hypothetical protein
MAPRVGAMASTPGKTMATLDPLVTKAPDSAVADLSAVLLASLKALADAGEAERACRLAGRACAILRRAHGDEWRRYNTLLHRLAPRAGAVGTAEVRAALSERQQ